jgi:carbonic anhydrase/acetyltransferase-like protein (isoleucine patch superfamily)
MPIIRPVNGILPSFGEDCFLADNAVIVGDVVMGDACSVWWSAVVRGDVNAIRIGHRVNIQDGAVIHCTYQKSQTIIGNDVSIGHNAIVHGCIIHDEVLVGMGAIIMDNAVVETHVLVAAGAVVLENAVLESGWIYAGTPAKKIKPLDPDNKQFFITRTAANYMEYARWFTSGEGDAGQRDPDADR